MYWPTADDYCEAMQDQEFCFDLPELQSAEIDRTPLGLPKVITGRFASVYNLTTGGERIALRCFLLPVRSQHRRYTAIIRHLRSSRLPYLVDFEYLRHGIKIGSAWYPILKMPWIRGEPLKLYVERNLHDSRRLRSLAKAWLRMLEHLRRNQICHSDLHHENVLVQDGRLRLIDYDGMYVPELEGLESQELGHRHYQHPERSKSHFGPYVDNFAGWVVYLSLLALSYQPELWALVDDEHLLFRQEDFLRPERARVWQELARLPGVAGLAAEFCSMLKLPPEQIKPPHALRLLWNGSKASLLKLKQQPVKSEVQFKGPDWVLDYLPGHAEEEEPEVITAPEPKLLPERLARLIISLITCSFIALVAQAGLIKPLSAIKAAAIFAVIELLGVWSRRKFYGSSAKATKRSSL